MAGKTKEQFRKIFRDLDLAKRFKQYVESDENSDFDYELHPILGQSDSGELLAQFGFVKFESHTFNELNMNQTIISAYEKVALLANQRPMPAPEVHVGIILPPLPQ